MKTVANVLRRGKATLLAVVVALTLVGDVRDERVLAYASWRTSSHLQ